ncbi:hypothetical protein [Streptomyces sp. NPDC048111]|uniref:hypothetical protein n=1 Tax=Streptomyces sp. NPDC048111 TaxID=3365500 RepID=UPI0037188652
MNQHHALAAALAKTVQDVPGVALLRPSTAQRLKTALSSPLHAAAPVAGLKISGRGEGEPLRIDVQIVTDARARALDIARAARTAIDAHLAGGAPGRAAHVTVTVTGIV